MTGISRHAGNWIVCGVAVAICLVAVTLSLAIPYTDEDKTIDCLCRTAEVWKFIGTDFDQGAAAQNAA